MTPSDDTTDSPRAPGRGVRAFLADLKRTPPETRAVLFGLLLVLGAWLGPGPRATPVEGPQTSEAIVAEGPPPASGAYVEAIRTAAVEAPEPAALEAAASDED